MGKVYKSDINGLCDYISDMKPKLNTTIATSSPIIRKSKLSQYKTKLLNASSSDVIPDFSVIQNDAKKEYSVIVDIPSIQLCLSLADEGRLHSPIGYVFTLEPTRKSKLFKKSDIIKYTSDIRSFDTVAKKLAESCISEFVLRVMSGTVADSITSDWHLHGTDYDIKFKMGLVSILKGDYFLNKYQRKLNNLAMLACYQDSLATELKYMAEDLYVTAMQKLDNYINANSGSGVDYTDAEIDFYRDWTSERYLISFSAARMILKTYCNSYEDMHELIVFLSEDIQIKETEYTIISKTNCPGIHKLRKRIIKRSRQGELCLIV